MFALIHCGCRLRYIGSYVVCSCSHCSYWLTTLNFVSWMKSTRFLSSRLRTRITHGGRFRKICLQNYIHAKWITKTQGTRGIGEKADVLDPGGRMVSRPASIVTRLISSTMFKPISTTAAGVPFESYGCDLKMWRPNSQGKRLLVRISVVDLRLSNNSPLYLEHQSE